MVLMNIDALIPYNEEIIQTKKLKELGYNASCINTLLEDGFLVRTRRGYYQVTIKSDVDYDLMKYYLVNNYYDEFFEYFDSLKVKDYKCYYYCFMADILTLNYSLAYTHLNKCCELNKEKNNKINLYAYTLLLQELMNLSSDKLIALKSKIFTKEDTLNLFLEDIINKNYDNAFKNLKGIKENDLLEDLDVLVLRELSLKAGENYQKKNSKEAKMYESLYNTFCDYIFDNDFDGAMFYFRKLYSVAYQFGLIDTKIRIIEDLFNCFNYIVSRQDISLSTYKTKYKYDNITIDNFYLAIKRNDYINALEIITKITIKEENKDYLVYRVLLERIYNFLNIRSVIFMRNPQNNPSSLQGLIKDRKYNKALDVVNKEKNMDAHDKNMVSSILELLVSLDDSNMCSDN